MGFDTTNGVKPPPIRNSPEFVAAAVDKFVRRADEDVAQRTRDQHLTGTCAGHHSGAHVNAHASDSAILASLRFTKVDADADLDAHLAPGVLKSQRAFDSATRTLEPGQRAIASMVRDATTEQTHVFSQDVVVTIQESAPRGISQLGGTFGRVDDVGKEQRHDDSLRFAAAPNAGHE